MKFFLIILGVVFVMCGCSLRLEKDILGSVAEVREFMLHAKDEDASVTLMCGLREVDYKANGEATELIEFGVITVKLFNNLRNDLDMEYVLFVGTDKYNGVMSKNPFDGTFVVDIHKIIDKNANVILQLGLGDWGKSYKLKTIDNEWKISIRDCVDILIKQYERELKSFYNKNNWQAEVYLKIIDESDNYATNFYLYVSVLGVNGSSISMVISPKTGDVLASNAIMQNKA